MYQLNWKIIIAGSFFVLMSLVGRVQAESADSLFTQGMQYLQENKIESAAQSFRNTIKADSTYYRAYLELGKIYLDRTWYHDAEKLFRITIELKPQAITSHNQLAFVLIEQDKIAEALDHFSIAESIDPEYPQTQYGIGMLMMKLKSYDEAVFRFDQAIAFADTAPGKLNTTDVDSVIADLYFAKGLTYKYHAMEADSIKNTRLKFTMQDNALEAFAEAIAIKIDGQRTCQYYFERGYILEWQERIDEAIAHYETAIAIAGSGNWEIELNARKRIKALRSDE